MTATTGKAVCSVDTGSATRASNRQANRPASSNGCAMEAGTATGLLRSGTTGTAALGAGGWAEAPFVKVVDIVTGSTGGDVVDGAG